MVTAVMADQLMADFSIGATALGFFSSFYYYSYVAVQIPVGVLADYWGPRKLLTAGTLLSSLGAFLFAFAPTLLIANLGRLIIGASIGVAWISILKLATRWFRPDRFAVMTGLALSLGVFGALSAGVPLSVLLNFFGWRPIIMGAGSLTLLLTVIIWVFVRDDPVAKGYAGYTALPTGSDIKSRAAVLSDLIRILRFGNTWILALAPAGLVGPLLTFSGLWAIPYLTTHYHLTPAKSATMTSILLIAWAAGGPVLGALSEKMGRRKPIYFMALCVALIGWLPILFSKNLPLWLIAILLGQIGFASGAIIIGFAFVKESVPPSLAGTATGVCNMGMEMGPMLLQPSIGWVLDYRWNGVLENGIRTYAFSAYQLAFSLMIGVSLLGVLMIPFAKETFCQQQRE